MKRILLFLIAIFFTTGAGSTGIGANDTTASCDDETLGQTSGTANIEVDWQPNTIDISWYSDNVLLSVQSSAQSCVYDDDLYLPAQPTKTGYTFKGWTVMNVPDGYTRLEYLESNGGQYIDTGIYFNSAQNFRVSGYVINPDISVRHIIVGSFANSETEYYYNIEFGGGEYPKGYFRDCIHGEVRLDLWSSFALPDNVLIHYDVNYNATSNTITNTFNYNGTTKSDSFNTRFGSTISSHTLLLFTDYRIGNFSSPFIGAMQIYQNDILIRNFIPARRNSDNELGMYDTVSGRFFTNAGSGTFIAGPVVH